MDEPVTQPVPASAGDPTARQGEDGTAAALRRRIEALAGEADGIGAVELDGHAEVYQRIHTGLQDALSEIDGH